MTSDSKKEAGPKKVKPKSKEESTRELQKQYAEAVRVGNHHLQDQIESILKRLGEPIRDSQIAKALKKHSK